MREGDTLRSVALALGTSEWLLKAVNPDVNVPTSGQAIALPSGVVCEGEVAFGLYCPFFSESILLAPPFWPSHSGLL
jgi:hypothetical protein